MLFTQEGRNIMATQRRQSGGQRRDSHQQKRESSAGGKSPNEGEGNKTADREYRQRTDSFIKSGRVEESAQEAERAVEGGERQKLEEAERAGREHRKS
jgi:hypothetical protein